MKSVTDISTILYDENVDDTDSVGISIGNTLTFYDDSYYCNI